MMSEVIEIGYYRDNVLLTYYAIDVLGKKSPSKNRNGKPIPYLLTNLTPNLPNTLFLITT